jgi:DNA-binding NarL/FixJ family response regulator
LIKSDNFQQVIDAIQVVSQGRRYLSEAIVNQIVNAIVAGENLNEERLNEKISMREREILQLIAEGNTSAQIGEKLVISTRTVETHRMNLMKKLGLVSQLDIVRFAVRQGLVSLD